MKQGWQGPQCRAPQAELFLVCEHGPRGKMQIYSGLAPTGRGGNEQQSSGSAAEPRWVCPAENFGCGMLKGSSQFPAGGIPALQELGITRGDPATGVSTGSSSRRSGSVLG